jgi:hypothetical protein
MLKLVLALIVISTSTFAQTNKELNQKINVLAQEIESLKSTSTMSSDKLSIGSYGEIVYSKTEEGEKDTVGSEPVFDNKRFILYIGYKFSNKWKLVSEIEIEHADEVYMEQAYLEYAYSDTMDFRVGTLLIPMGHLNLLHEPTTFLSVQRTQVETRIIPSTWRENGAGIHGTTGKVEYYFYYVTGLRATDDNGASSKEVDANGIRNGRQKASKSNAHKGAFVGRVDYRLASHVKVGASAYSGKLNNTTSDVDHNVYDLHYKGTFGAWHTRALYTELTLSNAEDLDAELTSNGIADKMNGYYAEVGYNVNHGKSNSQIIPFIRYEVINTQAEVSGTEDKSKDQIHQTVGIAYKPLVNIALKADYTITTNEAGTGTNSWNMGVGWNF